MENWRHPIYKLDIMAKCEVTTEITSPYMQNPLTWQKYANIHKSFSSFVFLLNLSVCKGRVYYADVVVCGSITIRFLCSQLDHEWEINSKFNLIKLWLGEMSRFFGINIQIIPYIYRGWRLSAFRLSVAPRSLFPSLLPLKSLSSLPGWLIAQRI